MYGGQGFSQDCGIVDVARGPHCSSAALSPCSTIACCTDSHHATSAVISSPVNSRFQQSSRSSESDSRAAAKPKWSCSTTSRSSIISGAVTRRSAKSVRPSLNAALTRGILLVLNARPVPLGRLRPDGRVPVPEADPGGQPGGSMGSSRRCSTSSPAVPELAQIGPRRSRDDPRSTRPAARGTGSVGERPSTCGSRWLMAL